MREDIVKLFKKSLGREQTDGHYNFYKIDSRAVEAFAELFKRELADSIPKSVVEKKMTELWIKCPKNSTNDFMITERNNKVEVLQELLEEEEV